MKPEEAIWHYNALKEHYLSRMSFLVRDRTDEISKEVIAMLEKQVPKSYDIRCNASGVCYDCPECGVKIDRYDKYCFNCGQKINWEETP